MNIVIHGALCIIAGFAVWMVWQFSHEWKTYVRPKK